MDREIKIIPASAAREKSDKWNRLKRIAEIERIATGISREAEKGNYEFIFDGYVSKDVEELLKELGYKVNTGTQRNESYAVINW